MVEQEPFAADGTPFPTQFWLTCGHLARRLAQQEAAGGVERRTVAVAADERLAASLESANAEQLALRPELPVGIAGSSRPGSLKCLHAHVAFALARPGYELGDRILAEVEPIWPVERCCAAA